MKQISLMLVFFVLTSCSLKTGETENFSESDNLKIESYFEELLDKKVTATIYIVHPEVCGACSNDFLLRMAKKDLGSKFYLFATGEFKKEHEEAANKIRNKIKFVESEKLGRIGLSTQSAQKVELQVGKIRSINMIKI